MSQRKEDIPFLESSGLTLIDFDSSEFLCAAETARATPGDAGRGRSSCTDCVVHPTRIEGGTSDTVSPPQSQVTNASKKRPRRSIE